MKRFFHVKGDTNSVLCTFNSPAEEGNSLYSLLPEHMKAFMAGCVQAIQAEEIEAEGTGRFSVILNQGQVELALSRFYKRCDGPELVREVVHAAKELLR
jgi:hypothetical protein